MSAGILDRFEAVPDFYPGTTREIKSRRKAAQRDMDSWDAKPKIMHVGDEPREFFSIGDLAKALGRRPVTIRAWESKGVIPKATYRKPGKDDHGQRRLYTREQIEGMVRIADEEGLLKGDNRSITQTDFTRRVIALFKELAAS